MTKIRLWGPKPEINFDVKGGNGNVFDNLCATNCNKNISMCSSCGRQERLRK